MPPVLSTLKAAYQAEAAAHIKGKGTRLVPAIPFYPAKMTKSKGNKAAEDSSDSEEDDDKKDKITFKLKINPAGEDTEDNRFSKKVRILKAGDTPEQYCRWRDATEVIFQRMGILGDEEDKVTTRMNVMASMMEQGVTNAPYEEFKRAYDRVRNENATRPDDSPLKATPAALLAKAINAIAMRIFKHGLAEARNQKQYLRGRIPILEDTDIVRYVDRLTQLNDWLPYFPTDELMITHGLEMDFPDRLQEDELIAALQNSIPDHWAVHDKRTGASDNYESLEAIKKALLDCPMRDQARKEWNHAILHDFYLLIFDFCNYTMFRYSASSPMINAQFAALNHI